MAARTFTAAFIIPILSKSLHYSTYRLVCRKNMWNKQNVHIVKCYIVKDCGFFEDSVVLKVMIILWSRIMITLQNLIVFRAMNLPDSLEIRGFCM